MDKMRLQKLNCSSILTGFRKKGKSQDTGRSDRDKQDDELKEVHTTLPANAARLPDISSEMIRNAKSVSAGSSHSARAQGRVEISDSLLKALSELNSTETFGSNDHQILSVNTPKGDLIQIARIAGIQATKQTHMLIPLCHQVPISYTSVDIWLEGSSICIESIIKAVGNADGIETAALNAVAVASVTVCDMLKSFKQGEVKISDIEVQRLAASSKEFAERNNQNFHV
ncbi:unnamed protein product [Calicophoron daubneyi]|uniref:Molybdopterin cofactor biosynthesis C (MoaC) domain-containing protein n=1 Tax=Calicophoron daubneyi TaxID=300641 RepID=A0AAV2T793_CALDB